MGLTGGRGLRLVPTAWREGIAFGELVHLSNHHLQTVATFPSFRLAVTTFGRALISFHTLAGVSRDTCESRALMCNAEHELFYVVG